MRLIRENSCFKGFERMLAEWNTLAAKSKIKSKQIKKQNEQVARKIHSKRLTTKR